MTSGRFQIRRRHRSEGTVGLGHQPVLKQTLIAAASFGALRQDEQSRRDAVETVDGHQIGLVEVQAGPGHDAFADETAVGSAREEVGLVDDEQIVVLEDHGDLEGNPLLGRDRPVEEIEAAGDHGIVPANRFAHLIAHIAQGEQAAPRLVVGLGELCLQPLADRVRDRKMVLSCVSFPPGARSEVAEIPSRGGSGLRGIGSV